MVKIDIYPDDNCNVCRFAEYASYDRCDIYCCINFMSVGDYCDRDEKHPDCPLEVIEED